MSGINLNRIKNKRMQRNTYFLFTGVSFVPGMGQWYARISFKGKTYSLGYFDELDDAVKARRDAEKKLHDGFISQISHNKVIEV